MGGDKKKLVEYVDFWFDRTKTKEGMGVYLRSYIDKDELLALVLNGTNSDIMDNGLDYSTRFAGIR